MKAFTDKKFVKKNASSNMNDSSKFDFNEFCPICQVPLKSLKIIAVVHISMCDVIWSELKECVNGVSCSSESIFHYRDFAHQGLATHRENLRKRKIEHVEEEDTSCKTKAQKEHRNKKTNRKKSQVIPYDEDADDEDNVFACEPISRRKVNSPVKSNKKRSLIKNKVKVCTGDGEDIETAEKMETLDFCEKISEICQKNASTDETVMDILSIKSNVTVSPVKAEVFDSGNDTLTSMKSNNVTCTSITGVEDEDFDLNDWEEIEDKCNENSERKEKCKAEWSNIFGSSKNSKVENKTNKRSMFGGFGGKKEKVCPYFKKMPGTGFAVDAFQFGSIPGITTYFLSHFHSDHYIGLKKSFSHPIYCSLITANLVKKKLRVHEKYLHVLELNQTIVINHVEITCFDANHCPGSLILLFRLLNGEQYLHVGDFRASPLMEEEPELQKSRITRLYLDTTYFNPQYVFPTQEEVINRVKEIVREMSAKYSKALFVTGTYLIGKEKVFLGILEELGCKLWAQPQKRDVFRCINDPTILSALTENAAEAKIHVLPMNHLRSDKLKKHLLDVAGPFSHIFAFKPTGWEMGRKSSDDWINKSCYGNITIYGVPYSEHSNFEELCRFINFVKADKVICTVPMKNREMYGYLKTLVDSYKGGAKQRSIQQFMTK